jgi:hypothetical protein
VNQIGVYAQDQWAPTPRLTLTAGLRLDVPFLPTPPAKNKVAFDEVGINTALTPSGNTLWSPRLGVNYDLSGQGTARVRGGVGLFAGPPAYYWFREVYARSGTRAVFIHCEGETVPAFTLDPANQPNACDADIPFHGRLNYFNAEFRFPQNLKLAIGADLLLPGGVVGTLDFLYTGGVKTFEVVDVSLKGPQGLASGEGNRIMYGTIDSATGMASPSRRWSDSVDAVFEIRNGRSGDHGFSATAQLQKRFGNGAELSVAYTFTRAKDRLSSGDDVPGLNAGVAPVNGTLTRRDLRTSLWEKPHKLTLVGTTDLPLGFRLGLVYTGGSSGAFTYVVGNDANADGFWPGGGSNDVVYVPRDDGDITLADPTKLAALERLIRNEPCLRGQRGRLLKRNSCHDPWVHETEARLSNRIHLADRRVLELTADLFNVLNFADGDWGLVRQTLSEYGSNVPLMELVGYDAPAGRGVYRLIPGATRRYVDVEASRWRLQFGATLSF